VNQDQTKQELLQTCIDYQQGIQEGLNEVRKSYDHIGVELKFLGQEACDWQRRAVETAIQLHELICIRDKERAARPKPNRFRAMKHNSPVTLAVSKLTQTELSLVQRGYRHCAVTRNFTYPYQFRAVILGKNLRHLNEALGKKVPN
jgi:hypothetical protein